MKSGNYRFLDIIQEVIKVFTILSSKETELMLQIDQIKPTWCMEIKYWLKGAGGETVNGTIHNTIHRLPAADTEAK